MVLLHQNQYDQTPNRTAHKKKGEGDLPLGLIQSEGIIRFSEPTTGYFVFFIVNVPANDPYEFTELTLAASTCKVIQMMSISSSADI